MGALPLCVAAKYGLMTLANLLIAKGADVNAHGWGRILKKSAINCQN